MIFASHHAIDRYVERVKPYLGHKQARRELVALVELGEQIEQPEWCVDTYLRPDSFYVDIGPEAVAVVRSETVITVMAKPVDEAERRRRNHHRKVRRAARRTRNAKGRRPSDTRPRIEAEAWPT